MAYALVAVGCNLGDRRGQLAAALELLAANGGVRVLSVSRWHETAPVGGPAGQGAFLNGALLLETSLAPETLRTLLAQIESQLGRDRAGGTSAVRWQARPIDLDLLLYDQVVLSTPALTVPHPRMAFRRFVLDPAAEVAPDMVHPLLGWRIDRLARHLYDSRPYVALVGVPGVGKTRLACELAARCGGRAILLRPASQSPGTPASGSPLAREIEFLGSMAQQLWSTGETADDLAISDFWLAQTLAYAELYLASGGLAEFRQAESRLSESLAAPRLRVLLTRLRAAGRHDEHRSGGPRRARPRAVAEQAVRSGPPRADRARPAAFGRRRAKRARGSASRDRSHALNEPQRADHEPPANMPPTVVTTAQRTRPMPGGCAAPASRSVWCPRWVRCTQDT